MTLNDLESHFTSHADASAVNTVQPNTLLRTNALSPSRGQIRSRPRLSSRDSPRAASTALRHVRPSFFCQVIDQYWRILRLQLQIQFATWHEFAFGVEGSIGIHTPCGPSLDGLVRPRADARDGHYVETQIGVMLGLLIKESQCALHAASFVGMDAPCHNDTQPGGKLAGGSQRVVLGNNDIVRDDGMLAPLFGRAKTPKIKLFPNQ